MTVIDPPLGVCPTWCEKPADHGWKDEWLNACVRVHVWARAVAEADHIRGDEIRIEEAEQHTKNGVVRRRTIVVDVEAPTEWNLDTAAKARDVLDVAIALAADGAADSL